MSLYVALLCLIVAANAFNPMVKKREALARKKFGSFMKQYSKEYVNMKERLTRYQIFKKNLIKIAKHNHGNHTWTMGVNQFTDLTSAEFGEYIHKKECAPHFARNELERANRKPKNLTTDSPLDAVDWDAMGKVTPVKNQGQCGSCWAFSTTGAVESRCAISKGTLTSLSEQELVDCAGSDGNAGCNGGLMDYGFEYVEQEHGLCTEADYGYKAKTKKLECSSKRSACNHVDSITGYEDVSTDSMDQLMAAVVKGPVSIAIEADQDAFQNYYGGVFTGKCGASLDHGVLVVGYGIDGTQEYWKVKNSWGSTWGESGYIRLCRNCSKNGRSGQCGILKQPSYPDC